MKETIGRRRGSGRTRIARALETGPKTIPQVAALLDTTGGALRAAVGGMERDGQIAKIEPIGRGQRWQLTEAGRRDLLEPSDVVEPGVVLPGQRLIMLVDRGEGVTRGARDVLMREASSVLWAARLDGNGPLLIAVDGGDPFAADRIRADLGDAGMTSVGGRVSDTVDARSLYSGSRPAISS
jgi:hypothetical protein